MKRENGLQLNGVPLKWLSMKIEGVSYKSAVIHLNKDTSPPRKVTQSSHEAPPTSFDHMWLQAQSSNGESVK